MTTGATDFDVIVLGGGPAGAATAITLRQRGLRVAIVEARTAPQPRVGETLPPGVRLALEKLGVWQQFASDGHDPAVGNRSYWGSAHSAEISFIAAPYGSGWHIDRCQFESMLLAAAQARGVQLFMGRRLQACVGGLTGWRLQIPEALRARFVVDASGRAAVLAQAGGAERVAIDALLAATMFLAPCGQSEGTRMDSAGKLTLIEATETGWWYSAPLPDGRLVVACMTDADLAKGASLRTLSGWMRGAGRAPATFERISSYVVQGAPQLSMANTARLSSVLGPAQLAVGDAAVSFDPLSSQGIITALACAIDAGESIYAHLHGTRNALMGYADRITQIYRQYLVERALHYGLERRWSDAVFWQRRQRHLAHSNERSAQLGARNDAISA